MTTTSLLLVPGLLCSPRLFAQQVAALTDEAESWCPTGAGRRFDLGRLGKCGALGLDQMPAGNSPSPACRWAA